MCTEPKNSCACPLSSVACNGGFAASIRADQSADQGTVVVVSVEGVKLAGDGLLVTR